MSRWIYFFGDTNGCDGDPDRRDILGGKGASLAAMCKAGLPVPPGFTISVECCRHYHDHGRRWPDGLEEEIKANIARLEKVTGRPFGSGSRPLLVSVRSGAAVSMPGMMDTLLNCGLHPDLAGQLPDPVRFWTAYSQFAQQFVKTVAGIEDGHEHGNGQEVTVDVLRERAEKVMESFTKATGRAFPATPWQVLIECINAVFESWNSDRAIVYRRNQDIRNVHGTAVNVQAMFPSEVSGIAFTANPSDPSARVIVVESSYGLGEAVVSGMVTPDLFVLDRDTLEVRSRTLGSKVHSVAAVEAPSGLVNTSAAEFSLTDSQLAELARISLKVEQYFGHPVDMEWGLNGNTFSLLQSRGIRGLDVARDIDVGRQEEMHRLRQAAGAGRKVWVAHNLSETLQAPTPLTWDIVRRFMRPDGGFGKLYRDLGYRPGVDVTRDGFLELICGRIYADPDRAAQLFFPSMPQEYDLDALVEDPGLLEGPPTKFNPKRADGTFLLKLPSIVWDFIRVSRRTKRQRKDVLERFQDEVLPPYLQYIESKRGEALDELSTEQLIAELHGRIERVMTDFGAESLKPGFFGGYARGLLEGILSNLMGQAPARAYLGELTSGLEGDTTVEQNIMLWEVAHDRATLNEFVKLYGHRCVGEMELSEARWYEESSYLDKVLQSYRRPSARSPKELHHANIQKRLEAEKRLPDELAQWGGGFQEPRARELLAEAQKLLPQRETGKHYLMMGYDLIRRVILELSRRWELGRDIFFLHLAELDRFDRESADLKKAIKGRKIRWQSAQRLLPADVVDSAKLEDLGRPPEASDAQTHEALSLAPGMAEGEAKIIFSPAEGDQLPNDCILICPSTDPGWTALFVNLRGLIVDRGGVLSHGAITARDFGIPAVACPQATRKLAGAKRVRIDATAGKVIVLE